MLISRQVVSLEKEAVREALGVRQWGRSGAGAGPGAAGNEEGNWHVAFARRRL